MKPLTDHEAQSAVAANDLDFSLHSADTEHVFLRAVLPEQQIPTMVNETPGSRQQWNLLVRVRREVRIPREMYQ